jgi:AsmA protein
MGMGAAAFKPRTVKLAQIKGLDFMNKPLKYTLLGLGGLVVIAVAGAAVFALTFDPNRYKADIERLAKEKTGRTLGIKGDIKMAFWPSLGADIAGVSLTEKGSDQQFVSFDRAHASVKLMPLLRGEYIVDSVKLSGVKARIVKGKDGRYNFSDLMEGGDKKDAQARKAPEPSEGGQPVVFDISSVSVEKASITYIDQLAGQEYAIEDFMLKTGRIAQDAEGKLELAMVAKRKAPALEVKLSADGKYQLKGGVLSGDVTAKLDESTIKAKFTAAEPYNFEASIDQLNVDRYLTGESSTPAAKSAPEEKKPQPTAKQEDTPIDLSALKGINAAGKVQVGQLQVHGLKLADLNAQIRVENGRAAIAPHSANLYEGAVKGEVVADANRNQISLKEQLTGIAIGPLLRDLAQNDKLEGKGDVALDITAAGTTVNAMKRSLAGTAKVRLADGAIKGINLAEIIQKGRSMLGGSQSAAAGQSANDNSRRTDFTELTASFVIKNGVAHNEDLDAKAPLFRLGGKGDINIPAGSLDYVAKAAVVATTKGQGGAERDRLAGLTVPVHLSGRFDDLKYDVDYRGMAGDALKSEVGEKLKDRVGEKLKDEKVRDKLKGLLGR